MITLDYVMPIYGIFCTATSVGMFFAILTTNSIKSLKGVIQKLTGKIAGYERIEKRLKAYETMLSKITDLTYIFDIEGNIVFVNSVFEKYTGHRPEEFIGKSFVPLYNEKDLEKIMDFHTRVLKGESLQFELSYKDTGVSCECKEFPLKENSGNVIGIIGVARDITDHRRTEEALRKSEASLANAQRIAHIGNWEWDIIENKVHWSDETYRIFGIPPQAFTATFEGFLDLVHPDDREFVKKSIYGALYQGEPYSINHRIILQDGSIRIAHCEGEVIFDNTGKAIQLNGTIQDVTKLKEVEEELRILNESLEQRVAKRTEALVKANEELLVKTAECKQAEERLQVSENKYKILLENLPQRIFYKDKNFIYISCNENFARDFHITPDEIRGKTDYDLYPKVLADKYRTDDKKVVESGQVVDEEEKYVQNGREMVVHTIKTPVKDEKGEIIGILGFFWDITDKVVLQKEAIRSRNLASLGELAAGVAHEINNPIMGVINYAQLLFNKSKEGSKERDIANRIIKEGNRVANIAHSLLSFARPCDSKERKKIVSIQEILSDTLVLTEAQLRKESVKIKLRLPEKLPKITAHPQQIQQVFLNAISNARYALNQKYLRPHDDKILEIMAEEIMIDNYPCIKIIFYDHGIGIPVNILDKVMDPFFTTKPRGIGTGLGLSVSHSIIKDHGGRLMIDSVEGEFTKIIVVLPACKDAPVGCLL